MLLYFPGAYILFQLHNPRLTASVFKRKSRLPGNNLSSTGFAASSVWGSRITQAFTKRETLAINSTMTSS